MTHPSTETAAHKLRQSNKSGDKRDDSDAVDAHNDLNRSNEAKGRPDKSGPSNAGRDGGA